MKQIIALSLLLTMFFIPGFAFAGYQSDQSSPVEGIACQHPTVVTTTVGSQNVFAGPKVGWLKVPVKMDKVVCNIASQE